MKAITIRKVRGRGWRVRCNEKYCKETQLVNPIFTPFYSDFYLAIQIADSHLKKVHDWQPGDPAEKFVTD